jgi:hypothetical protein
MTKKILNTLLFLIVISAIYRIIPNRPMGFAPQIAMTLFGGALFSENKKWAFSVPIFSMLISDCLYHILYVNNLSTIPGFYSGQIINYILFAFLTFFGFGIKNMKTLSILPWTLISSTSYFLVSNLFVWVSGGGYRRLTLLETYVDGLPFYINSMYSTVFFSILLFGTFNLITKQFYKNEQYR